MDKQPKLIDAEKLLKWMTTNPEAEGFWNDENVVGVNMAYEALQSAIDIGSFDPDPIPPTIKQGDKVKHWHILEPVTVIWIGEELATIEDSQGNRYDARISDLEVSHD